MSNTQNLERVRSMLNKKIILIAFIITLFALSGCGVSTNLPDNPVVYEQKSNAKEGYVYLSVDDKIYVPYCPWKREYLGDCIGYYVSLSDEYTESNRVYVYEFKDYSSDEWIVDYLPTINEGMVMREINTTDIPPGLESEYEWNAAYEK